MQVVSASKGKVESYKYLLVWKKAVELAVKVYKATNDFPKNQQYSLVSQMERSAVSVSSNIAEGAGRKGSKEYAQYVSIAKGSLYELETQLIISYIGWFFKQRKTRLFYKGNRRNRQNAKRFKTLVA
ncbi:MAG: four helix bundle protein, partial [Rickettsiaceae bacterium]|nr:four helix bundle protein [Rickettsiaceae bacterium]